MTRDEAVVSYLNFAKQVARRWWRKKPNMREDIEATALLALVKAFDAQIPETDIERRKFVTTCINNAIKDFFVNDKLMRIPKHALQECEEYVILDSEGILAQLKKIRAHQEDGLRLQETIDSLNLDNLDQDILTLRIEGYKQKEIAALLCISPSAVCVRLKSIQERYERRNH